MKTLRTLERSHLSLRDEHLLEKLLSLNLISEDQKQIVLTEVGVSGQSPERLLVDLSFVSEEALNAVVAELGGSSIISLRNYAIDMDAMAQVPLNVAEACVAIPIGYEKDPEGVVIAMADVNDLQAYDKIRRCFPDHYVITTVMASCSEILEALHTRRKEGRTGEARGRGICLGEDSAVHFAQHILHEAVRQKASDIHLEPETVFVRVRYRCDGILKVALSFHQQLWSAVCVHLKVLSGMDIAETRRPQDGRFTMTILGRPVDFRVSSHPNIYGENIVIRILDKTRSLIALESLGYSPEQLSAIKRCLHKPEGIFIVTGPTGAGKTTTLYAMLALLDAKSSNIMTLEEPVEYCLPHIRQTEVKEGGAMSFAEGLRSILRQDPDVILVGEMRDKETANIAIRAAMTGHLVLSTLHTNNALGAIYRFMDFEIPLSLLSGHLNGILAQRLIRVVCEGCKEPHIARGSEEAIEGGDRDRDRDGGEISWRGAGCEQCNFRGYRGRQAVAEILEIDEMMEELILRRASLQEVSHYLGSKGYETLKQRGQVLIKEGKTSIEEVRRVVGY